MNRPVPRPSVAASEPAALSEGPGTGQAAVEALARVLDPEAFDPPTTPRDVGLELYRHDRRRVAVLAATRALAAGYRLVSEEPT